MTIHVQDPGFVNGRAVVPNYFEDYDILLYRDDKDGIRTILQVITASPWIYTVSLIVYVILNVLLSTVAVQYGELTTGISWGATLTLLQLAYFLCSFTTVEQQELAGLLFFGKVVRGLDSGWHFVPFGFFELIKRPKPPVQKQFPADPEEIFKRGDKEYFALTEEQRNKLVLPIRILASSKELVSGEVNILDSQLTVEVTGYVRFGIEQFWVFYTRINTLGEAVRQLRDSFERALAEDISKLSPREVSISIGDINERLTKALEEITEDWGIRIFEAAMLPLDLGKDINVALQGIVTKRAEGTAIQAIADAQAYETRVKADAEKHRLTAEGEGAANAQKAELLALAEGRKALEVTGGELLELEKARAFAKHNPTIFIEGGNANGAGLLGIGARLALGSDVARKDKPTSEDT